MTGIDEGGSGMLLESGQDVVLAMEEEDDDEGDTGEPPALLPFYNIKLSMKVCMNLVKWIIQHFIMVERLQLRMSSKLFYFCAFDRKIAIVLRLFLVRIIKNKSH